MLRDSTPSMAPRLRIVMFFLGVAIVGIWLARPRVHSPNVPVQRRWTVDATPFPDSLQSYGGAAVCTSLGEWLGWCGHSDVARNASALIYLRLPDVQLRMFKCIGAGPASTFPSAAIDFSQSTMYVFGGWSELGPTNDLYRIALGAPMPHWEKIGPQGPLPSPRNGAPMVFDRVKRRLIVCGGDGGTNKDFRPLADRWQFDLATSLWKVLPDSGEAPPARWNGSMTVDPISQKAYLYGGAGLTMPVDDGLYELDLRSDTWRRLATTGSAPPALQGATLTFDDSQRVLLLAGGLRHSGVGPATLSQVWVFDPSINQWDE